MPTWMASGPGSLAHLLARQPLAVADQLLLHLPDQRHGAAEAHEPKPQKVGDQFADASVRSDLGSRRSVNHHWFLTRCRAAARSGCPPSDGEPPAPRHCAKGCVRRHDERF